MNTPSTSTNHNGFSVSLKFSATSVMLYRNGYRKDIEGKRGESTQTYLCSFSRQCTDIPSDFEEHLRQATAGKPERYAELLANIHTRVLEPARKKAQEQQLKAQEERMKGRFSFTLQEIESVASSADREAILANTEIQQLLRKLVREAKSLLVEPKVVQVSADVGEQDALPPEQKVLGLLRSVNEACTQLIQMMPFESKYFHRGYQFGQETIDQVKQMWFNTSDANRALTVHEQLHRPKTWTDMRSEVMGK